MKVTDFEGYMHNWPPKGHQEDFDSIKPKSELHLKCRKILRQLYPTQRILEECKIPNEKLFLDFYLPAQHKAIEVQGQQHYIFNPLFYQNQFEFAKAKQRDSLKKDWCKMNGITLIELRYDETEDKWVEKIKEI